jgi:regulator of protease activity HflC (stomatin/prohibitin superfamily)
MDDLLVLALLIVAVAVIVWMISFVARGLVTVTTIYDYQSGLRYRNGKFAETLGPGRYWSFRPTTTIIVEDMREQLLTVSGQEMLSADNLSVKVSLAVRHRTREARQKHEAAEDALELIYNDLQIALRQTVAGRTLDSFLENRGDMSTELMTGAVEEAGSRGVEILGIDVRDVMLSGETKRAFSDIFRARKDGEAALERARGETAALRNLANGARLLKGNPGLFNLRLLQTLTTSAAKGATVVLNTTGEPLDASTVDAATTDSETT